MHGSRAGDIRIADRLPRNQTALDVVDDFRVPLHLLPTGKTTDPMRVCAVGGLNRLQMLHETWQIGEIAPESIELFRRPRNVNASLDLDCFTSVDGRRATGDIIAVAVRRFAVVLREHDASVH